MANHKKNIPVLATLKDWQAIQKLERQCYKEIDVFKSYQLRYLLSSKTCISLVLRVSDIGIAGNVIGLIRHFRIPSGRIYNIAVAPSYQRTGMGSQLLKAIEKSFLSEKMVESYAEVRVSNLASRSLFEKNGYNFLKILPHYYPDGEDGLKFRKLL